MKSSRSDGATVVAEAARVQQVEKQGQVKVQEAEIVRHEKELIAKVLKVAEAGRTRIETLAAADRQRLIVEAEAEIIFRKGEAEARAMNVKAEAYQEWNQVAVVDKLMTMLGLGTHALTVEWGGNEQYLGTSTTLTVTVEAQDPGPRRRSARH